MFVEVGHQHDLLDCRQVRDDLLDDVTPVEILAAIAVAVDGEQHLGLDLPEAVDHRYMAHVGRCRRPDRADARYCQQRHHSLRNVRHVGDHAVARLDPKRLERVGDSRNLAFQFVPGHFRARLQLRLKNDRGLVTLAVAQCMFGIVQCGPGKPFGAWHGACLEHLGVGGRGPDVVVGPDAFPESFDLVDGPMPQRVVVRKAQAARLFKPLHVGGEARVLEAFGGGLPEQGAFGDGRQNEPRYMFLTRQL